MTEIIENLYNIFPQDISYIIYDYVEYIFYGKFSYELTRDAGRVMLMENISETEFITLNDNNILTIWNLNGSSYLIDNKDVTTFLMVRNNRIYSGNKNKINIWNIHGELLKSFIINIEEVEVLTDDRIVTLYDNEIFIWDINSNENPVSKGSVLDENGNKIASSVIKIMKNGAFVTATLYSRTPHVFLWDSPKSKTIVPYY